VTTLPLCEFREPDGSYVLVRPHDDVRCRVIDSNVFQKGEVLSLRGAAYDWVEGSEDIGGCTRIGLAFLLRGQPSQADGHSQDLLNLLADHEVALAEHRHSDPEEDLVDPRSLAPDVPERDVEDLRATLRRLADHYRSVHGYRQNARDQLTACICPGFAPDSERARDLLGTVMTLALRRESLPPLRDLIRQARYFNGLLEAFADRCRERVA